MFKLDNDFLVSLGLGTLPVDEKNKLLQAIYERLEMNVGMRLAERMTDAQLDEFESFIDRNDESGALRWLETNFPNYKDVVAEELEKLKTEVRTAAPQILLASQTAPVAGYGQPPVPPSQPKPSFGSAPAQPQPVPQPQYQPPSPQPFPTQPGQPPQPTPPPEQPVPPSQPPFQPQPGFPPAEQPTPQQFTPPPPGFTPEQ